MSSKAPDETRRLRLLPAAIVAKVKITSRRLVGRNGNGIYRPLDSKRKEIRVLDVQPSLDADNPVVGSLRHIILPPARPPRGTESLAVAENIRAPAYETISYCWGTSPEHVLVYLQGQAVAIPASADEAIRRMREPHKARTLWIDSVCINQNDKTERGRQVAIMGDVYAHSRCNLVWLGESDETTAEAFRAVEAIYDEIRAQTDGFQKWTEMTLEMNLLRRKPRVRSPFSTQAIEQLYSKPWFTRLWVLQEVALAPYTVCFCGSYYLPLLTLLRVTVWLSYVLDFERQESLFYAMLGARYMRQCIDPIEGELFSQPFDLGTILASSTSELHSTLRHDRVYALLGLIPSSTLNGPNGKLLEPDYEKPVHEVLQNAVAAALSSSPSRNFFRLIDHPDLDGYPGEGHASWMPYTLSPVEAATAKPSSFFFLRTADQFRPRAATVTAQRPHVIQTLGVALDVVARTSDPSPVHPRCQDLDFDWQALDAWLDACTQIAAHDNNASNRDDMAPQLPVDLACTLVADTILSLRSAPRPMVASDLTTFARYRDLVHEAATNPDSSGSEQVVAQLQADTALDNCAYPLKWACRNRRFFATKSGRIGIGPLATRAGDLVAVLYGEGEPIVLRPCGEQFLVVGSSYVHGVMDGEALEGDVEERMFDLI